MTDEECPDIMGNIRFRTGEVQARELYDHKSDPAETVNVAGADRYAEDVQRLAGKMRNTLHTTEF